MRPKDTRSAVGKFHRRRKEHEPERNAESWAALFSKVVMALYQIAFLAVWLVVDCVERLALQTAPADAASEAGDVEDAIHRRASGAFSDHFHGTAGAHP